MAPPPPALVYSPAPVVITVLEDTCGSVPRVVSAALAAWDLLIVTVRAIQASFVQKDRTPVKRTYNMGLSRVLGVFLLVVACCSVVMESVHSPMSCKPVQPRCRAVHSCCPWGRMWALRSVRVAILARLSSVIAQDACHDAQSVQAFQGAWASTGSKEMPHVLPKPSCGHHFLPPPPLLLPCRRTGCHAEGLRSYALPARGHRCLWVSATTHWEARLTRNVLLKTCVLPGPTASRACRSVGRRRRSSCTMWGQDNMSRGSKLCLSSRTSPFLIEGCV